MLRRARSLTIRARALAILSSPSGRRITQFFVSIWESRPTARCVLVLNRFFDEHFDIEDPALPAYTRREHETRYECALAYATGSRVLDIGCGFGYGSARLARVAVNVTGLDPSHESIDVAARRYADVSNLN